MAFSFANLLTINLLHSAIIMLASTGPSDPPMLIPSISSYNLLLKDNVAFSQLSRTNLFNEHIDNDVLINFSLYTRWRIILTVLRKGTFVNNKTTYSKANIYSLFSWTNGSILLILLAASLSKYSFCVERFNSPDKFFQLNSVLFQWCQLFVDIADYYLFGKIL